MNESIYSKTDNSDIIGALAALTILNSANEKNLQAVIPYSAFYNPALVELIDFKLEFKKWRTGVFSFFDYPFLFDALSKSRILRLDALAQMSLSYENAHINAAFLIKANQLLDNIVSASRSLDSLHEGMKQIVDPLFVLQVRREYLLKDVSRLINEQSSDLKKPLKVQFVGGGEDGMDQGGVQKEFFQILMGKLLDPKYGMFEDDEITRVCWFNHSFVGSKLGFELIGTIIGLALYNGVMISINFPPIFYKKILGNPIYLEDIIMSFPVVGKGLKALLDWEGEDVEEVFCLDFTFSIRQYGKMKVFQLCENGTNTMVTTKNRRRYVDLYIHFIAFTLVERNYGAFEVGFHRVISTDPLSICRWQELELLLCGTSSYDIDISELKQGVTYDDGYSIDHQLISYEFL